MKTEKIINIKSIEFDYDSPSGEITDSGEDYYYFIGILIETNYQKIYLGINNWQLCCENYGYLLSEDNMKDFIGANIIKISLTDTAKNKIEFLLNKEGVTRSELIFVDIETDKGVLQFVAYNEHNGYYGHTVLIKSKQLNLEKVI